MNTRYSSSETPHAAFGAALRDLRQRAGIGRQADLARLIRGKQQTVNRWEAGVSRPRQDQIPKLAAVLKAPVDELMTAAGYAGHMMAAPFDQPFPVHGLSPESFERFCLFFLGELYPGAAVSRLGKSGHTQEGADIEVRLENGTVHSFQCKRVEEFGPQKVHAAVAKHKRKSGKKFLVLSGVASPRARDAVAMHKSWALWDQEDISLRIRQLPMERQRRLVDIFFRGQRMALLGDADSNPWQTTEEFFAPFDDVRRAFSHNWRLVGRDEETARVVACLGNNNIHVVIVVGAGGGGKTRVTKEAVERYKKTHPETTVRILSPTEEITAKSLEELGECAKLLVVDDAHDRSDLPRLFQYAAAASRKAKLLLALRPYGAEYVKQQAGHFALACDSAATIELKPLELAAAADLARQVLKQFGGPAELAEDIARVTRDCPLALVMGAQIMASGKFNLELAKNEELFRSTLLGRFQDVVAGEIGTKADEEPIRKLLRVIALLQPVHPEDKALHEIAMTVEALESHEVSRLFRLLIEAGILFKRGGRYRLSPDLLADHVIESACIGLNGVSTGYAERVFDAATGDNIEHLLLNLGKLDWRRADGDPRESRLLVGLWQRLKPEQEYADPYIRAVSSVAYFQPDRALTFAAQLIDEGRYLRDVPDILRHAAFTQNYVRRACELLWGLGFVDARPVEQNPNHAMRVLAEMCAVTPNKPIEYNEIVVDFGLSLLSQDSSWRGRYTPFDFLKGILQTDGHVTEARGLQLTFSRFDVRLAAVAASRTRVIDATIEMLTHHETPRALLAARFVQHALHYPMNAPPEVRAEWAAEFAATLKKLRNVAGKIGKPMVLIALGQSVSWQANYGGGEPGDIAKAILDSLPDTLEFRTTLALADGFGHLLHRYNDENHARWEKTLDALAMELIAAFDDPDALRSFVEGALAEIAADGPHNPGSSYVLVHRLIGESLPFARCLVESAAVGPESGLTPFVGVALAKLGASDPANGFAWIKEMAESESEHVVAAAAHSYCCRDYAAHPLGAGDEPVLRSLAQSDHRRVVQVTINAIRQLADVDEDLAIRLVREVNVGDAAALADNLLLMFAKNGQGQEGRIVDRLQEGDVVTLLKKLQPLPALEGHWMESFLAWASKHHALLLADFFMKRVESAADADDWSVRPCNYGPYTHVRLRFRESTALDVVLRTVSRWMRVRPEDRVFNHHAADLFDAMFSPFDDAMVTVMQGWVDTATAGDVAVISRILRKGDPKFVFTQYEFVARFLERARQFGKEAYDDAISSLYASAVTGLRSGRPGEPFSRDLEMKQLSEDLLKRTLRHSAEYRLYDYTRRHADEAIREALRSAEAYEE